MAIGKRAFGTAVRCLNCDYVWNTTSEKAVITCPACVRKTERVLA